MLIPSKRSNAPAGPLVARIVAFTAVALFSVPALADPILYNQPPQSPVVSTRASQHQGANLYAFQTFDSFSLLQDSSITGVTWQGSYFNFSNTDPGFAPPKNSSAFTLEFYGDSSGAPGLLLGSQTFTPAAANETFVAQQAFTATLGLAIYNYSAVLAPPFLASAGTTYWLSVVATSPLSSGTEAQWGWNGGTGGDGTSRQAAGGGSSAQVNNDRAFTLSGTETTAVPEPSTLLLLGAGLAALRKRVWRKAG